MKTKRIEIKLVGGGWVARFVGDAEVLRLFGTDTLPTAYTARTPEGVVLEEVAARNPGHLVTTAD